MGGWWVGAVQRSACRKKTPNAEEDPTVGKRWPSDVNKQLRKGTSLYFIFVCVLVFVNSLLCVALCALLQLNHQCEWGRAIMDLPPPPYSQIRAGHEAPSNDSAGSQPAAREWSGSVSSSGAVSYPSRSGSQGSSMRSSSAYPAYPAYPGGSAGGGSSTAGEVKLYSSVAERRLFEDLANFYSIIKALDVLECAFTKDAVTSEEYSAECAKLLAQHKTQESALQRSGAIKDTAGFMMKFKQLHCPHAMNRINQGKPATHALGGPARGAPTQHVNSLAAFEAASQVITAKDEIAMDITRVMDIHPLLRDIVDSFSRFEFPGDGKEKIVAWVTRLNALSATEELSAEDKQQVCVFA